MTLRMATGSGADQIDRHRASPSSGKDDAGARLETLRAGGLRSQRLAIHQPVRRQPARQEGRGTALDCGHLEPPAAAADAWRARPSWVSRWPVSPRAASSARPTPPTSSGQAVQPMAGRARMREGAPIDWPFSTPTLSDTISSATELVQLEFRGLEGRAGGDRRPRLKTPAWRCSVLTGAILDHRRAASCCLQAAVLVLVQDGMSPTGATLLRRRRVHRSRLRPCRQRAASRSTAMPSPPMRTIRGVHATAPC